METLQGTIFVDENIPLLAGALAASADVITFNGRALQRQDLIDKNCQALLVRSTTKVGHGLLEDTAVSFVGTATSGIDHVDTDYLTRNRIDFEYARGSNSNSVAEYVVYAMLKWAHLRDIRLNNQTIGIVGYGNIGSIVGRYASYMGMRILVNDPPLKDAGYEFPDYIQYVERDDICRTAAVITNHVPLTGTGPYPTAGIFGEKEFEELNAKALFIHASRGYVADEAALLARMRKNDIYAAIDVWENEPLINIDLARCAILSTPHVAGYSRDGKLRGSLMMASAVKSRFGLEPNLDVIYNEILTYKPLPQEDYMNEDRLYELLMQSRRIDEDSSALLETLYMTDDQRKDAFDKLRKNYPDRREIL